ARISLKNPWLAALLAFLLPGLGHFYQGRLFKGTVYAVCILGTFLAGMCMGENKVVYFSREPGQSTYGYFSQMMVGIPALPAMLQTRRYQHPDNVRHTTLEEDLDAPFEGIVICKNANNRLEKEAVQGEISLRPVPGEFGPVVKGTFTGSDSRGQKVEFQLSEPFEIDKPIAAGDGQLLVCEIVAGEERDLTPVGQIEGVIPRPWINRFEVPLDKMNLEDLNGRLGKYYELALVYTWIAGLLNILAIWDAFEGPAYGYGDEYRRATSPMPAPVHMGNPVPISAQTTNPSRVTPAAPTGDHTTSAVASKPSGGGIGETAQS
ncbi:MAG: DUF6677 family protein, partial [Planctomycetaceae bacterium]